MLHAAKRYNLVDLSMGVNKVADKHNSPLLLCIYTPPDIGF